MKRNVYLDAIEYNDVSSILSKVLETCNYKNSSEMVNVKETLGRVTFRSVFAHVSSPSYNASAMDGVAIKAVSAITANETNPVTLNKNDFEYINTGNILPNRFDTVVMIEDVHVNKDGSIKLYKSFRTYENVRPIGEDITKGDLVLPIHHQIRPIDISALISAGIEEIEVIKKIKVAIIPTGDEIVQNISNMKKGHIQDSNSYYVKNELDLLHVESIILPIQRDEFDILEETFINASKEYDLLLIGAGSSAGSKDYVKAIVEQNGTVFAHGINIKPGKPTVIGEVGNTPLIGMPGYPVSTYITFEKVVKPLISLMMNLKLTPFKQVKARLTQRVYSSLKNHEFVRVALSKVDNELVAIPLNRKAGVTMSVVKANGVLTIPKNSEGYDASTKVIVDIIHETSFDDSIVVIGSHDILFDHLVDTLSECGISIISTHTGSMGGVLSIRRNECHIAPVHILHIDGTYNKQLIPTYLNNDYVLIKGIKRTQGLYVKKGNPKNIKELKDIKNYNYVNRQRGSGTRVLLDYLLKMNQINSNDINGYDFELATHILVAESVKDDRFDVGMGIKSVSEYTGVDFIEIAQESYDFIVKKSFTKTKKFKLFIKALQNKDLQSKLKQLGGYDFTDVGEIL